MVAQRPRWMRLHAGAALAAAACAALAIGLWAGLSGGGASKRLGLQPEPAGAVLEASGFARAPVGKIDEIWVIEKGQKPAPAGLFRGGGTAHTRLGRPAPAGSVIAVTLERMAGSPTPPILAAGDGLAAGPVGERRTDVSSRRRAESVRPEQVTGVPWAP